MLAGHTKGPNCPRCPFTACSPRLKQRCHAQEGTGEQWGACDMLTLAFTYICCLHTCNRLSDQNCYGYNGLTRIPFTRNLCQTEHMPNQCLCLSFVNTTRTHQPWSIDCTVTGNVLAIHISRPQTPVPHVNLLFGTVEILQQLNVCGLC